MIIDSKIDDSDRLMINGQIDRQMTDNLLAKKKKYQKLEAKIILFFFSE